MYCIDRNPRPSVRIEIRDDNINALTVGFNNNSLYLRRVKKCLKFSNIWGGGSRMLANCRLIWRWPAIYIVNIAWSNKSTLVWQVMRWSLEHENSPGFSRLLFACRFRFPKETSQSYLFVWVSLHWNDSTISESLEKSDWKRSKITCPRYWD